MPIADVLVHVEPETAGLAGGDDLAFRARVAVHTMGEPAELEALVPSERAGTAGGSGRATLAQARVEALTADCEVGGLMAEQLRLPDNVCHAVRCGSSAWDGRGVPQGLAGEAIPAAARIALAEESTRRAEWWRVWGPSRRRGWLDEREHQEPGGTAAVVGRNWGYQLRNAASSSSSSTRVRV